MPDQAAVALRDERDAQHTVRTQRIDDPPFELAAFRLARERGDDHAADRVGLAGTLIAQRDDLDRCVRIEHHSDQPIQRRALRNTRIHGSASPQLSGCQLIATVRCTRSMCGISTEKRPSAVVTDVMPAGDPFGLNG